MDPQQRFHMINVGTRWLRRGYVIYGGKRLRLGPKWAMNGYDVATWLIYGLDGYDVAT